MDEKSLFTALRVEKDENGNASRSLVERQIADLPAGELLLRVEYSSLNFKDALSATGRPGVTKKYPHTPGIDAVGTVAVCSDGRFAVGEKVLVTGFDLGMNTDGGYAQYVRVPSSWALSLPEGLSAKESMILGTAGLTAGLSLWKLAAAGVTPEAGEILVTGATGGVGSVAVALLGKAGYEVTAVTGKSDAADLLQQLGATTVISREEALAGKDRPLGKERWGGVIDCVGGEMLATALKATRYGGVATCCGLVGSADLPVNVFPFILRGVSLLGIDSVEAPLTLRQQVWEKLAGEWKVDLGVLAKECALAELEPKFEAILAGQQKGRVVVKLP